MKKRAMAIIAFAASVMLAATTSAAQATENETEEHFVTSHVTLTDIETGEVLYTSTEEVPLSDSGSTTISTDIAPDSDIIQPFSTVGGTVNPGSLQSSITLTYTKLTQDVRLERAEGSWAPGFSIEVANRHVRIINGGVLPDVINKYPTSNSYNYTTGWGFVQYNSSTNYVPRVLAEVDHRLSGTNGKWVRLTHWVDLSSV